jgi:hypothetical protein
MHTDKDRDERAATKNQNISGRTWKTGIFNHGFRLIDTDGNAEEKAATTNPERIRGGWTRMNTDPTGPEDEEAGMTAGARVR